MSIIWGGARQMRYLGLARLKTEGETLAISLSSIRDELLPGLQGVVGRSKSGWRIDSYVEFNSDWLVVTARWGDDRKMLKISRYEIEDGKYIAKLREFVEMLMCASKGSVPVARSAAELAALAKYQQLSQQKSNPTDWNYYGQDLVRLVRKALEDNPYKQEFTPNPVSQEPAPKITARDLTKEELRERVERRLDLDEAKAVSPVDALNHARWRQVMDEVFRDDEPKGEDHGARTQEGSNGGRKRGNGTGGSDAG